MPRNGSGVYGPPAGTTAVPNTPIESAKYNAFVADASQAFTDSVNVQGTATFQANQPMGGFKHTNLGAGSASTDSAQLGQTQSSIVAHAATVGGTADAITVTFSPAFAAYTAKARFRFTAAAANATATPTINVDSLGAKTIKKLNGAALGIGDIAGAGHVCDCAYDGTDVVLLNPALIAGDRKQTFNKPVVKGVTILADAPTIAWDLSTGADFEVTITSNRVLGAFTGGTAGQEGLFTVKQDGTGGWSLNLANVVYDFWGPSIEDIARGPNDSTVYEFKVISAGSLILRRLGATSIGGAGRDILAIQIANNSPTIDFILTKWLALYDRFEIYVEDLLVATDNADLWLRTSTNAGSSYDSAASDYAWLTTFNSTSSSGGIASTGDAKMQMTVAGGIGAGLSNAAGETASATIVIHSPGSNSRLRISWLISYLPSNVGFEIAEYEGTGARKAIQDTDAVRVFCNSGNIASGKFRLYGIRG